MLKLLNNFIDAVLLDTALNPKPPAFGFQIVQHLTEEDDLRSRERR